MNAILKIMLVLATLAWSSTLYAQMTDEATGLERSQSDEIQLIAVYPNPATARLLVEFIAPELGTELLLRIKNEDGKVVLRRNLVTAEGGNMVILPVASLPVGEYTVVLAQGRKARQVLWQKM